MKLLNTTLLVCGTLALGSNGWASIDATESLKSDMESFADSSLVSTAMDIDMSDEGIVALTPGAHPGGDMIRQICSKVSLTDAQKNLLKKAHFAFKKKMITNGAAVQVAKIEYGEKILDTAATKTDAQTASHNLAVAISKTAYDALSVTNDIFFDILQPDQREAGLHCMMAMKMMRSKVELHKACMKLRDGMPENHPPISRPHP